VLVDVPVVSEIGDHFDNQKCDRSGDIELHGTDDPSCQLAIRIFRKAEGSHSSSFRYRKQRRPQPAASRI
jgi:hypothetical protein